MPRAKNSQLIEKGGILPLFSFYLPFYLPAVKLYILTILPLFLARVVLFILYDFVDLNLGEIILSFLMGFRIDIMTVNTFAGTFFLLLIIPMENLQGYLFRVVIGTLWFLLIVAITILAFGDTFYFKFVNRHITKEDLDLQNDLGYIIKDEMFGRFLPYTLLTFAALGVYFVFLYRIFSHSVKTPFTPVEGIVYTLIALAFIVIGARGKLGKKSFQIADAFFNDKASTGNLSLNGVFTFYRSTFFGEVEKIREFKQNNEDLEFVKEVIKTPQAIFISREFPLERKFVSFDNPIIEPSSYNIIIFLIESFNAKHIDSFNEGVGSKFQVTPNFDNISSMGLMFTNFFANGVKSLNGITAVLTGIIKPFGFNTLGFGLEESRLSYLGRIARENGYHTIAMQSSLRKSFRIDKITKEAGFIEYYGAEDMGFHGPEEGHPVFGTWDRNMYILLLDRLRNVKEPFLVFMFTSATHSPYKSPGKRWEKYPHDENGVTGYLNTLYYADWAIGDFMEEARKYSWFKNTIFFFLADHAFLLPDKPLIKMGYNIQDRQLEFMRIPLTIYAPEIIHHQKINTVGSQVDIFPTILQLMGAKNKFTTVSNSLLTSDRREFAINLNGYIYTLVTPEGYIKYDQRSVFEKTGDPDLNILLKIDEVLSYLLLENHLFED